MSTIKTAGKGTRPVTVISPALESGDLNESGHWEVSQEEFDRTMKILDEWIEERESYLEFIGAVPLQERHQKLLETCRTIFAHAKKYRSMIQRPHEYRWGLAMFIMGCAGESVMEFQVMINRFVSQTPIRATQAKRQKVEDRIAWLKERIQEQEMTPEEVKGNSRKQLYEQYSGKWRVGKKTFSRDLNRVQALIQRK